MKEDIRKVTEYIKNLKPCSLEGNRSYFENDVEGLITEVLKFSFSVRGEVEEKGNCCGNEECLRKSIDCTESERKNVPMIFRLKNDDDVVAIFLIKSSQVIPKDLMWRVLKWR